MAGDDDMVVIENINTPGRTQRVNRTKYDPMRTALLAVLTPASPGLTVKEAKEKLLPLLPKEHFPGGATVGWWMKTVQLDLEAKGLIKRENTKPLRLRLRD